MLNELKVDLIKVFEEAGKTIVDFDTLGNRLVLGVHVPGRKRCQRVQYDQVAQAFVFGESKERIAYSYTENIEAMVTLLRAAKVVTDRAERLYRVRQVLIQSHYNIQERSEAEHFVTYLATCSVSHSYHVLIVNGPTLRVMNQDGYVIKTMPV